MRQWQQERVDERVKAPARFPHQGLVFGKVGYYDGVFGRVDEALQEGALTDGRLDIESGRTRLSVLIHRSGTHSAGIVDEAGYAPVPLREVAVRARQMVGAMCSLAVSEAAVVLMMAVQFHKQPELQGSTRYIDPSYVLRVLAKDRADAAIVCERDGAKTLVFVQGGRSARLYFADPGQDPGGSDLEERLVRFAFSHGTRPARVEVFKSLRVVADPERGSPLVRLLQAAEPCPPTQIVAALPDGRTVAERAFQAPELVIGRDPAAGLVLDNLAVSRRHARILWEWGAMHVEDLGSQNGTLVNGEPVERAELSPDDVITVGKFAVRAESFDGGFDSETMFVPLRSMQSRRLVLEGKGGVYDADRELLVGSSDGVDVPVRGLFVAPVHARIAPTEDGRLRVTCLANRTVGVDGQRVRSAELDVGETVKIGRATFEVSLASAS